MRNSELFCSVILRRSRIFVGISYKKRPRFYLFQIKSGAFVYFITLYGVGQAIVPYRKNAQNIGFATVGYRIRPYDFMTFFGAKIITHYELRITH